jgi:hypothetical protein
MVNNYLIAFFLILISFLFFGCSAQMHASKGWRLLDQGQPDEAIEEFEISRGSKELPGYYMGMYNSYLLKK